MTERLARLARNPVRIPAPGSQRGDFIRLGTQARAEEQVKEDTVKKLIMLAVVLLGLAAVWRKVQADRAELDLWTEATTADE
jgi:hypothetical protein